MQQQSPAKHGTSCSGASQPGQDQGRFHSGSTPAPRPAKVQEPPEIQWLESTTRAVNRLPWLETNLPDGRVVPKPEAAANLLWLLLNILEDSTVDPTAIIPTSRGGVAAEWHTGGIDLEIEGDPDGTVEYNFTAPDTDEYEGPLDADLSQLKRHVGMLPKRAQ